MNVLGIETSTQVCSVGLAREDRTLLQKRLVEERIHSEKMLTLIQSLLSDAGMSMREIDVVAVSIGPGSFTGLRIGLSTAKGLCFSLDRPLVTVPTFDALARACWSIRGETGNILVALDAKKGDFYRGRYLNSRGLPVSLGETRLVTKVDITNECAADPPDILLTDNRDFLRLKGKTEKPMALEIGEYCRGDIVAQIGLARAKAEEYADAASCEPMYLKDFVILGKDSEL